MTSEDVVDLLGRYAAYARAPVQTESNVTSLRRSDGAYELATSRGPIRSRTVVIATGACNLPAIPALADGLPAEVVQLTPFDYRNPSGLSDRGVLVVGA